MELKIDHEFETRIPPLTREEFDKLEENIHSQMKKLIRDSQQHFKSVFKSLQMSSNISRNANSGNSLY